MNAATNHAWRVLALVVFCVLAYLPSFDAGFLFDDVPNIVNNPTIHPESLGELLEGGVSRGKENFVGNRIVAMYTFAVDHLLWGFDPIGYHLVNLVIHVVNATLLYTCLILLFAARGDRVPTDRATLSLAFFGALLWALHPVNTQAVTYIVQRMTSLCVLFYLSAMVIFLLYRTGRIRLAVAAPVIALAFLLGMGTKPIMVTLPATLLLLDLFIQQRWLRAHSLAVAGVAVLAGAVIAVWGGSLLVQFTQTYPGRHFSGYERLLTEGRVLWHYLGLWFWPDPGRLQLDYDIVVSRGWLSPPSTLLAWAGLGVVTAAAAACARRLPWLALAWFFFLLASSVEASFLNLELVFEHRLYLPSIFVFAALLTLIPPEMLTRATVTVPLLLLAGVLAFATVERNREWADTGGFWARDLERGASLNRAAQNAALRYSMMGRPEQALMVAERALPEADGLARAQLLQQAGEALLALGRLDEARERLSQTYAMAPNWTRNRYFLGRVALAQGQLDDAARLADELNDQFPRSAFGIALRGLVLQARGQPEEAVEALEKFLQQRDFSVKAGTESFLRMHLAGAYRATNRSDAAYAQYQRIVDRDPQNWAAWVNIYRMLRAGGDVEQATRVKRYLDERNVDIGAWEERRATSD